MTSSIEQISLLERDRKQFIIECIQLYKNLPALWNTKSKLYYDRNKKNVAYNILLRKYKTFYPNATRMDVRKKFNVLRTNYRKEVKKIQYKKSKEGPNSTYKPTLWYFNELTFIDDQKNTADLNYSLDNKPKTAASDSESNNTIKVEESDEEDRAGNSSRLSTSLDYEINNPTRHYVDIDTIRNIGNGDEKVIYMGSGDISEKRDEFYYWAMSCASDLREMDSVQRIFAKKAIADIMMEGRLGTLHRNSMQLNKSSTQTNKA